jgi:hypothetical protein
MSLPASAWGSHFWKFLHITTLAYPLYPNETEKKAFSDIIDAMCVLLPCEQCRKHLNVNMIAHPLTDQILSIKINLIMWVYELHSCVNHYSGKPNVPFERAILDLIIHPATNPSNTPDHVPEAPVPPPPVPQPLPPVSNYPDHTNAIDLIATKYQGTVIDTRAIYQRIADKKIKDALDEEHSKQVYMKRFTPEQRDAMEQKKMLLEKQQKARATQQARENYMASLSLEVPKQHTVNLETLVNEFATHMRHEQSPETKHILFTVLNKIIDASTI